MVYQVPAEIKQPTELASRYPLPLNEPVLVDEADAEVEVAVAVAVELAELADDFGRYLIPVDGQFDVVPAGSAAMNCPLATDPLTR